MIVYPTRPETMGAVGAAAEVEQAVARAAPTAPLGTPPAMVAAATAAGGAAVVVAVTVGMVGMLMAMVAVRVATPVIDGAWVLRGGLRGNSGGP